MLVWIWRISEFAQFWPALLLFISVLDFVPCTLRSSTGSSSVEAIAADRRVCGYTLADTHTLCAEQRERTIWALVQAPAL